MKPSMYPVVSSLPGSIFIMPKPSGEWLTEDIGYYRSVGVDTVVSLLEPVEVVELSLQREREICAQHRIDFINLAVKDRSLPSLEEFEDLISTIVQKLRSGKVVAVHCRAGIGRSGMVVCCALLNFGHSALSAIELVSRSRGVPVPDTTEQRDFIERIGLTTKDWK